MLSHFIPQKKNFKVPIKRLTASKAKCRDSACASRMNENLSKRSRFSALQRLAKQNIRKNLFFVSYIIFVNQINKRCEQIIALRKDLRGEKFFHIKSLSLSKENNATHGRHDKDGNQYNSTSHKNSEKKWKLRIKLKKRELI